MDQGTRLPAELRIAREDYRDDEQCDARGMLFTHWLLLEPAAEGCVRKIGQAGRSGKGCCDRMAPDKRCCTSQVFPQGVGFLNEAVPSLPNGICWRLVVVPALPFRARNPRRFPLLRDRAG